MRIRICVIVNANGICQYLAGDKQAPVLSGVKRPFHKRHTALFQFDTGNPMGMNAASRVAVRGIGRTYHRAVGVPRNQDVLFPSGPLRKLFFRFPFSFIVFGGAGGIPKAQQFRRPPEITDEETADAPQAAVKKINLMPVCQIDISFVFHIF